jgi:lysozyme family protein
MTAYFRNKVIPFLWEWEGTVFENDPDDPGGATKYGIDQRSHPNVDIKNLTSEEAMDIYWQEWVKDGCEHLPAPLDWLFFDACVNCGIGRAQQFLNASARDPKKFQQERSDFYTRLAEQKPRLAKFKKGWLARVNDLSKVTGLA